jgi:hypothetical protein
MIDAELIELKLKIESGTFPKKFPHFGGANLIITDDPNRPHREGAVVFITPHASAMSWLVVELKRIYDGNLDYLNKYSFYPRIGELIQESFRKEDKIFDSMLYVVEEISQEWSD